MKDSEILDTAITNIESLSRHLYTFRKIVAENGNLDEQHRQLKGGLEELQRYISSLNKEVEVKRTELAGKQEECRSLDKEIARLGAECNSKRTELQRYSDEINKIRAMLEAA
jgi:chromosome segregation ATPase